MQLMALTGRVSHLHKRVRLLGALAQAHVVQLDGCPPVWAVRRCAGMLCSLNARCQQLSSIPAALRLPRCSPPRQWREPQRWAVPMWPQDAPSP